MLINEASKTTHLTKKAIEYYTEQKLVSPDILENGYRDFNDRNIEELRQIAVLRKLGLRTEEIRAVLDDESVTVLKTLSVERELSLQKEHAKKALLNELGRGKTYREIDVAIASIEKNATITERLLEAFPGYYGHFVCLHFARFLNEPITDTEQQTAYQEIISYLDNLKLLEFPEEIQAFLEENSKIIGTPQILNINEQTQKSIENPEGFLTENKEFLEYYLALKKSEEYKNSPAYKLQALLKEFNCSSGYYDVFLPAMKRLSASYAEYCRQMENANDKLLLHYPEIANLYK